MNVSAPIVCTGLQVAWATRSARHGNLKYSDQLVDEWIALLASGMTPKQVARRYLLPSSTLVRDRVKRRQMAGKPS